MGIISAITGNAGEVNVKKFAAEFEPILVPGEELLRAYQVIRDYFVFTNKRLILVDVQGVTGSKAEYMTIPFSSILRFSKESKGMLDMDAELKIWIRGRAEPIVKEFRKDKHVNEIYRILSAAVLE
jgi:hypothetical protein